MPRFIRVRDAFKEFDWPADALLDGITPVENYPDNPTDQPRPSKPIVPLGSTPDSPSARTGSTQAALAAESPKE